MTLREEIISLSDDKKIEVKDYYPSLRFKLVVGNEAASQLTAYANDNATHIWGVMTKPQYQGKGYMKKLFSYAISYIKKKHPKSPPMQLEVDEYNKSALNLYKSLGFKETQHINHYYIMTLK